MKSKTKKTRTPKPKPEKVKVTLLCCTVNGTKLGTDLGQEALNKGDVLAIRADMAPRVLTQYNPRFKEAGHEEAALSQGFYEVRHARSETRTDVGEASDKSMGTQSGRPKRGW
jgi:hypothetical protein